MSDESIDEEWIEEFNDRLIGEEPIKLIAYSRVKHKKWNKEGKADIVICGKENPGWCDEVRCEECGDICYYSSNENLDLKKKNIKKICCDCVLDKEKYRKFLNEEQIKIIEMCKD